MRPLTSDRLMHRTLMGPTGAAIERPMTNPLSKKAKSILPSHDISTGHKREAARGEQPFGRMAPRHIFAAQKCVLGRAMLPPFAK